METSSQANQKTLKLCICCLRTQPTYLYGKCRSTIDKLNVYCKTCVNDNNHRKYLRKVDDVLVRPEQSTHHRFVIFHFKHHHASVIAKLLQRPFPQTGLGLDLSTGEYITYELELMNNQQHIKITIHKDQTLVASYTLNNDSDFIVNLTKALTINRIRLEESDKHCILTREYMFGSKEKK